MRKINYDIGYCYLIDAKPFEYKNFIVYNMGIDVLFKVIKDKKPFYFTAEAVDGKTDLLPDRALFDDFYASDFINISIDPFLDPEWGVIGVDFNSEAGKAFARNFSYIGIFEQFYLNGTRHNGQSQIIDIDCDSRCISVRSVRLYCPVAGQDRELFGYAEGGEL